MEIKLSDYVEQRVIETIAEAVQTHIQDRIDEAVRGAIKGAIDAEVKRVVAATVRPEVETVLAEGWQPTDQWGESRGEKVTLRQRVNQILSQPEGSYDRTPWIQKVSKEILDGALRAELGKEIEAARKQFRAEVDAVLQAKIRESLASTLGLKVA
jgi:hypothetical protein